MKTIVLVCVLVLAGAARAQPAERCETAAAAPGAPASCPKAPASASGTASLPARAEAQEGADAKQSPHYKSALKQQCDAMNQAVKTGKLGADQEAQVREQHRAFRCG
ncbi:MAG: hypothetical protein PGN26_08940 [Xylophilus ampelinus]